MFKYSDTQYISLTLDKILNSLLFYVNIYGSYKLLKQSSFLAHPVYWDGLPCPGFNSRRRKTPSQYTYSLEL